MMLLDGNKSDHFRRGSNALWRITRPDWNTDRRILQAQITAIRDLVANFVKCNI